MLKPTTYERIIQPTEFGIARPPTLRDFYSVWNQLNQQNHLPLKPISVKVAVLKERVREYVTEDDGESIKDLDNLKGISETREVGGLPIRDNSAIYFESPDSKYIGALAHGGVALLKNKFNIRAALPQLEILSVSLLYLSPLIALVTLDGIRRGYNFFRPYLSIVIGSPEVEELTILRWKKDQNDEVTNIRDAGLESLIEPGFSLTRANLNYTSEDLKRFQQFVEHIKKIKI